MSPQTFDDSNITWRKLDGFDDVAFFVYKVDEEARIVDVIYKFAPNARQPLHRHTCPYNTLVLQGELRFYRPNGELKEIRPIGSYVTGVVNGEPHFEGAGARPTSSASPISKRSSTSKSRRAIWRRCRADLFDKHVQN